MAYKTYRYQAEAAVREYLLADSFFPFISVLAGLFMCKMAYDLTRFLSSYYFKCYSSLTKIQRLEWNNRGMSTVHAIFITVMSVYLVFFSDLFSDDNAKGLIAFRNSNLSTFTLGLYVHMVLISEATTPGINVRWYLDAAGMKRSSAYLVNGVIMFFAWLVARIILFLYLFYHVYLHYDQVVQMHIIGYLLVFLVPSALSIMNLMWFGKIIKGLKKTLAKRH